MLWINYITPTHAELQNCCIWNLSLAMTFCVVLGKNVEGKHKMVVCAKRILTLH